MHSSHLQNYFRDFWNVFDFIIVVTTLVGVVLELKVSTNNQVNKELNENIEKISNQSEKCSVFSRILITKKN